MRLKIVCMINNISWASYWLTVFLLTGTYYIIVILLYYRKDFKRWASAKGGTIQPPFPSTAVSAQQNNSFQQQVLFEGDHSSDNLQTEDAPEAIPVEQSLVDEVQAFFEGATENSYSKEWLLSHLKTIVQKYPSVENTLYKNSVGQLIIFLAEQNCSVHLSAEEVMGIWLG